MDSFREYGTLLVYCKNKKKSLLVKCSFEPVQSYGHKLMRQNTFFPQVNDDNVEVHQMFIFNTDLGGRD